MTDRLTALEELKAKPMTDDLKPCPFCEGEAEPFRRQAPHIIELFRCKICLAEAEAHIWNTRADPQPRVKGLSEADILGALARGYCAEENQHKTMDSALCMAMAKEILSALDLAPVTPAQATIPRKEALDAIFNLRRVEEKMVGIVAAANHAGYAEALTDCHTAVAALKAIKEGE